MVGTRPVWIVAVGVALACFAGAGVLARVPDVPASLDAAIAAAEQRRADRLRDREPGCGEGTAGDAMQHYATALCTLADRMREMRFALLSWNEASHTLSVAQDGWRPLRGEALRAFRTKLAPALAEMRIGARCRDASSTASNLAPFYAAELHLLALAEIAMRRAEGSAGDALALWVDLATFSLDVDVALFSRWTPEDIAALPTEAAVSLAAALERIERRLVDPLDVVLTLRWRVDELRQTLPMEWSWQEGLAAWEHGFDASARHLAALEEAVAHVEVFEGTETTAAARDEQWQLFQAINDRTARTSCVVASWIEMTRARDRGRCFALADLRSLRIGLAARLGNELPGLIDPTTDAPFRVDEDGAFVVVHRAAPHPPDRWVRCP